MRSTRVVLAIVVIAAAVVAIAAPVEVGRALGRTASSSSEMINLRASWGGALLGIGAAIGWARTETRGRLVVSLLMWLMIGIGLARAVGFVLDGDPDRLQWLWLAAEIVIASACAWWLRRQGRRGRLPPHRALRRRHVEPGGRADARKPVPAQLQSRAR